MISFGQKAKFQIGKFVLFGDLNTHCKIVDIQTSHIDADGYRFKYQVEWTNLGGRSWVWEHQLT